MAYENPDAQELSEILDAVSNKVPDMITNILKTVYSAEAGRNVGQAVGNLFRELMDAGIPYEMAVKMASDYMISFKDLLGTVTPAMNKSMSAKVTDSSEDE
jgi:hypothetical protein